MERMINIAFLALLLIPVAIFMIIQNRHLLRMLVCAGRKRSLRKPGTGPAKKQQTAPVKPLSLQERRKKRFEERNKALYR